MGALMLACLLAPSPAQPDMLWVSANRLLILSNWHTKEGHQGLQTSKAGPQRLPRTPGRPMESASAKARPRAASGWRATHRLRTAASGASRRKRRVARLPSGKRTCAQKACVATCHDKSPLCITSLQLLGRYPV